MRLSVSTRNVLEQLSYNRFFRCHALNWGLMTNDRNSNERILVRLPKLDVVYFIALEVHFLAIIGFSVFGILRSETSFLTGSIEDVYRFWLALLGAVVAYFFSRHPIVIPALVALAAAMHWIIPIVLWLFAESSAMGWRDWAAIPSGGDFPTGYQTALLLADIALIAALLALISAKPKQTLAVLRSASAFPLRLFDWVRNPAVKRQPGQKFLGIALSVQVFYVLVLFVVGLTTELFFVDSETLDDKVMLGFALLLAAALIMARWRRLHLIAIGLFSLTWNWVLSPIFFNALSMQGLPQVWSSFTQPSSSRKLFGVAPTLELLNLVNLAALMTVLVTLILIAIFAIVRKYSAAVARWFDARHLEVYGRSPQPISPDEPREVSVTAVLSLIFAFVAPLIGLILSYSARNTIVYSKGKKTGLELTVAAAIISWFFIFVLGSFFLLIAAAPLLGAPDAISSFWSLIFDALDS